MHPDDAARIGRLDHAKQQVIKHLPNFFLVQNPNAIARLDGQADLQFLALGRLGQAVDRLLAQHLNINRSQAKGMAALTQISQLQILIHQGQQVLAAAVNNI